MTFRSRPPTESKVQLRILAWRYFRGHLGRYRYFLITAGIGFAVITVMSGLTSGMRVGIRQAAYRHYGGELFVMGFPENHGGNGRITEDRLLQEALADAGMQTLPKVRRTNLYRRASLLHMGSEIPLKYVMGIDWDKEMPVLETMVYAEGGLSAQMGADDIVISDFLAEELDAAVGDELLLRTQGPSGRIDVGSFVLKAVYSASDVFGTYKVFIDRTTLNGMVGYGTDDYSYVAMAATESSGASVSSDSALEHLRACVAARLGQSIYVRDRQELHRMQGGSWAGTRYFIISLDAFISEADDLLEALDAVSRIFFALILAILIASVFITYRLILRERVDEIATLRALGMARSGAAWMFLMEGVFLAVSSVLLGLCATLVLRFIAGAVPVRDIPGFEIFLRKGRLAMELRWQDLLANTALLASTMLISIFISVQRVLGKPLVECFGGEG